MSREEQERLIRKQLEASWLQWRKSAVLNFKEKIDFEAAVVKEVFPAIVFINSSLGRQGMGFFQHSSWLASNAHVIPHREHLNEGVELTDTSLRSIPLRAEQSYHRPYEQACSPDIVIINTSSRPGGEMKGLPTLFSGDKAIESYYYFYLDTNLNIRFIKPLSKPGELPLRFSCEEEQYPVAGCSGTPILKARITAGKTPTWQFMVVGALYARCPANKFSSNADRHGAWEVCGMPVAHEFKQILTVIQQQESATRLDQMAAASELLRDTDKSMALHEESRLERKLATINVRRFEEGETPLVIDLPPGLERLSGSTVIAVLQSAMPKRRNDITQSDLEESFHQFIELIRQSPKLQLSGTGGRLIDNKFWRVDYSPGANGTAWSIQLQDNTGDKTGGKHKSSSSVFGQISLPISCIVISGRALAEDMKRCQDNLNHNKVHQEDINALRIKLRKAKGAGKTPHQAALSAIERPIQLVILAGSNEVKRYDKVSAMSSPPPENVLDARVTYAMFMEYFAPSGVPREDRIEALDSKDNTALMLLLQDPKLTHNSETIYKAAALVRFGACWESCNKQGNNAQDLLGSHPAKEKLTLRLGEAVAVLDSRCRI